MYDNIIETIITSCSHSFVNCETIWQHRVIAGWFPLSQFDPVVLFIPDISVFPQRSSVESSLDCRVEHEESGDRLRCCVPSLLLLAFFSLHAQRCLRSLSATLLPRQHSFHQPLPLFYVLPQRTETLRLLSLTHLTPHTRGKKCLCVCVHMSVCLFMQSFMTEGYLQP